MHNGMPVAHRKRRRRDAAVGENTFWVTANPSSRKVDSGLTIKTASIDLDY